MSMTGKPVHCLVPHRGPKCAGAAGLALAVVLMAAGCGGGGGSTSSTPSSTSSDRTSSAEVTSTSGTSATTISKPNLKKLKKHLSTPASPDAVVQAALTGSLGATSLTCHLYTDALLKSAYGDVNGCEDAIKAGGSAKSVKIVSSDTSGSTATVVAVPSGGPSSGEKLTYTLAMDNGQWRLDKVDSNVKVGP
jgi:hypothetical protein